MRKEQGFTLIELLIVLAILGILIGIVAMSVGDLTNAATRRGMMAERETVQTAIDSWNTLDAIENDVSEVGVFGGEDGITLDPSIYNAKEGEETESFEKYLRRATKYTYKYTNDPELLEVCDTNIGCLPEAAGVEE